MPQPPAKKSRDAGLCTLESNCRFDGHGAPCLVENSGGQGGVDYPYHLSIVRTQRSEHHSPPLPRALKWVEFQDHGFAGATRSRTKARQHLPINRFDSPEIRFIRLRKKRDPWSVIAPDRCILWPRRLRGSHLNAALIDAANTF